MFSCVPESDEAQVTLLVKLGAQGVVLVARGRDEVVDTLDIGAADVVLLELLHKAETALSQAGLADRAPQDNVDGAVAAEAALQPPSIEHHGRTTNLDIPRGSEALTGVPREASSASVAEAAHDGMAHDGMAHDGMAHDGMAHDGMAHDDGRNARDSTARQPIAFWVEFGAGLTRRAPAR